MQQNRYFRNLDWWLVIAIFGLIGIGICLIASATHSFAVTTGKAWHVERQSLFLAIDLALVIFSLRFDYRLLKDIATPLYVFNIILLLAVYITRFLIGIMSEQRLLSDWIILRSCFRIRFFLLQSEQWLRYNCHV